jgi:hypothetical protein
MTAEQYLAWVHYQAEKMPVVFRAEVSTISFSLE